MLFFGTGMFQQALDELVTQTGADFAVFCDYEGEFIALSAREADTFFVRLVGAQLGACTTALQRVNVEYGLGERAQVTCELPAGFLLVEALPDHYYIVLQLPKSRLLGSARWRLRAVGERFSRELV